MQWNFSFKTLRRLTDFDQLPFKVKQQFNKVNINTNNFHCKYSLAALKLSYIEKLKILKVFKMRRVRVMPYIASFKSTSHLLNKREGEIIVKSRLSISQLLLLRKQNNFIPIWEILGIFLSCAYQRVIRNQETYAKEQQLQLINVKYILPIYSRGQKKPIELDLSKVVPVQPLGWEEKPELVDYHSKVKKNWELYSQEKQFETEFGAFPFTLPDVPKNIAFIKLQEFLGYSNRYCIYKEPPQTSLEKVKIQIAKDYAYETNFTVMGKKSIQKRPEESLQYYKTLWKQYTTRLEWDGDRVANHPEFEIWNKRILEAYYGSKHTYTYGPLELRFQFKCLSKRRKINLHHLRQVRQHLNLDLWELNRIIFYNCKKIKQKKLVLRLHAYSELHYLRYFSVTDPLANCYAPWRSIPFYKKHVEEKVLNLCKKRGLPLEKVLLLPIKPNLKR